MFISIISYTPLGLYLALIIHAHPLTRRQAPAELVQPPITSFIDRTLLSTLNQLPESSTIYSSLNTSDPWSTPTFTTFSGAIGERSLPESLQSRNINVLKCASTPRRLILRQELQAARDMILKAATDLSSAHPVWRALLAPNYVDDPGALKRIKGILKVTYDSIGDPKWSMPLRCDVGSQECLQQRNPPGTSKDVVGEGGVGGAVQVPVAMFDNDRGLINTCTKFFTLPQHTQMSCIGGFPMEGYASTAKGLIHEIVHAVFKQLEKLDENYITHDFVYGFANCASLAAGQCSAIEDVRYCHPVATIMNVDTIAWLVNGFHWYNDCTSRGLAIPFK